MIAHVLNRTTSAFIDFNPMQVRLQRRRKIDVAGGGWKLVDDYVLPEQRCRMVLRSNVSDSRKYTMPDGRIVIEEARLVFELGADVQSTDTFDVNGVVWEVSRTTSVLSCNAEVFRHA